MIITLAIFSKGFRVPNIEKKYGKQTLWYINCVKL